MKYLSQKTDLLNYFYLYKIIPLKNPVLKIDGAKCFRLFLSNSEEKKIYMAIYLEIERRLFVQLKILFFIAFGNKIFSSTLFERKVLARGMLV